MTNCGRVVLIALALFQAPLLRGQATGDSINKQLMSLGVVTGVPLPPAPPGPPQQRAAPITDDARPGVILQLSKDIGALAAGVPKVKFAAALVRASSQGVTGPEAMQASANALAQALTETPQPPAKDGQPAQPYIDLAKLARYASISTSLKDPQLTKAGEVLVANDADLDKVDFTLKDANGKKFTFSSLKGKIVLVYFWDAPCVRCRKEMQDLDLIYTHYQQQGLEILMVITPSPENVFDFNHFLLAQKYHPPVLMDDGGKVGKAFHIDGVPRTFVFDRDQKLVGKSIDMCTQRQFFVLLAKAGLKPN